jgi:hypothetical protein
VAWRWLGVDQLLSAQGPSGVAGPNNKREPIGAVRYPLLMQELQERATRDWSRRSAVRKTLAL